MFFFSLLFFVRCISSIYWFFHNLRVYAKVKLHLQVEGCGMWKLVLAKKAKSLNEVVGATEV